jgi:hypothetical protein
MSKQLSALLAVAIAPLIPVLLLIGKYSIESDFQNNWIEYFAILSSVFFSYLCFFLVGIPTIKYLRRIKRYSLVTLTISGCIGGAIGFYLTLRAMVFIAQTVFRFDLKIGLFGMMIGASVAISYWVIEKITTKPV